MSSTDFSCVFCNEKLPSKSILREHFRSHTATPNNGADRNKNNKNSKYKSKTNLVPCDVCTELFDTVTKAISHKFKKHPDTPNNNFCPWCGKQFPIKHIRDKHMLTHGSPPEPSVKLACLECGEEFCSKEAVKYHGQSFHRKAHAYQAIQTPPPSNKIYLNGHGDLLSAYFCHLCGQEYVIKYNLQKHINSVHGSDPVPPPDDIVKCKTCDALFYSVGAYEFHNTFHKPDDLYVTSEEMRKQVVTKVDQDFDFRRVKLPVKFGRQKYDVNEIQIGGQDSSIHHPTPEAVTLTEFVNMNKEIFSNIVETTKNTELNNIIRDPLEITGTSNVSDKKIISTPDKELLGIRRMAIPKGIMKPGVKVLSKVELERLKKRGLISVVPRTMLPANINRLHVVESMEAESSESLTSYSDIRA